jgi:DNA polymerase III epsilon subunit-like protein
MDYEKYVILDLETTGLDPVSDKIIKLTTISFKDETFSESETKSRFFNPKIKISDESAKIHGITNSELEAYEEFKYYAKSISKYFENSHIIGFGIFDFHIPVLMSEFIRSGIKFDITKINIIDLKVLYEKLRPRNLQNALREFCSTDMDVFDRKTDEKSEAILELFLSQQTEISEKKINLESILNFSNNSIDKDGFIGSSDSNEIFFTKGKYQNKSIKSVIKDNPDYIKWLLENENISPIIKMIINNEK